MAGGVGGGGGGGGSGGFRALNRETLREYIRDTPSLSSKFEDHNEELKIEMVNEGLMNFVYIVTHSSSPNSIVLKQALPYIRSMGESYPMSRERIKYEVKALQVYGKWCPSHVPQIYHFDDCLSLAGMTYLEPPHILLTKGLISGIHYPLLSHHISHLFANVFFKTSLLYTTPMAHKNAVGEFSGNVEMISLMEQLAFKEAFGKSQYSSWTSPELDVDVKALHDDPIIKFEVDQLKAMFGEKAQALIHADLHGGSIMVTQNSTKVIDFEFAFYGPMGYDIATFFTNLIVSFFAQDGFLTSHDHRQNYKMWLLRTIEETWNLFEQKFIKLWDENKVDDASEALLSQIHNNPQTLEMLQRTFMQDVFQDSLAFCASHLIGSVIHVGPVEYFVSISNVSERAECERKTLNFGKMLLKNRRNFNSISELVSALHSYTLISGL